MEIILPESLQKEIEALAEQQGINVHNLIIEAIEQYIEQKGYLKSTEEQKFTPRQQLRELTRSQPLTDSELLTEVRLAKAKAYQLYLDNEELLEYSAKRVAESRTSYEEKSSEE